MPPASPTLPPASCAPSLGGPSATATARSAAALVTPRRVVVLALTALAVISLALFLPALADLPAMWARIAGGAPEWLALALVFEVLSFLGHIVLFQAVCVEGGSRIGMRASYQITMAGHAATRLFASAGAGGVALTAWALRRSGMDTREVATRMVTFLVLLYSVYMVALVVGGLGLWLGWLPGSAPFALTVIPAAFGAVVIGLVGASPLLPADLEARATARAGTGRAGRGLVRLAAAPAVLEDGVREAGAMIRRVRPGLVGALMWWGFDIAVLWACFHAFGEPPAVGVLVVAFFVGMLANTLPLPGGVGGVDGGMIGALIAFGVDPGLAVLAVLGYRGFAFWLPIAPGALAYLQLRRTIAGWGEEAEDLRDHGDALPAALRPEAPPARETGPARDAAPALATA